jgi:hypothetical protein
MNRAEFPAILANLRRAGNPAAAAAKARELAAVPTVAGGSTSSTGCGSGDSIGATRPAG